MLCGVQPPWMPVELVCGKSKRAQSASADGMRTDSRDTDWPASGHATPQAASIWAERAEGLLDFDWATRRLRNPRPVLTPDRNVVQHFPRHWRNHETCRCY